MIHVMISRVAREEIFKFKNMGVKTLLSSLGCEYLTQAGYFSSVYAYQCYYQVNATSVVVLMIEVKGWGASRSRDFSSSTHQFDSSFHTEALLWAREKSVG